MLLQRTDQGMHRTALPFPSHANIQRIDCAAATHAELHGAAFLARLEAAVSAIEEAPAGGLVLLSDLGIYTSLPHERPDIRLYNKREQLLSRISKLPCRIVATVDGPCSGLHLELALLADTCLATRDSSFGVPELALGYLPGATTLRAGQLIGLKAARRLLFSGTACTARSALQAGLVEQVCAVNEFEERIGELSRQACANSALAVQLSRRLLQEAFHTSREDALGHFIAAQHRCFSQPAGQ